MATSRPNDTIALPNAGIGLVVDSPTHGLRVIEIDAADYPRVSPYRWHVNLHGYAFYAVTQADKRKISLHRLILPESTEVDHIDRNGLNNRRVNLLASTRCDNLRNRRLRRDNSSGFRGVWATGARWRAAIWIDGTQRYLGYFDTPESAAHAFDAAARAAGYPEQSLNFPEAGHARAIA